MLSPEQHARVLALSADLAREGRTEELAEFLDHGLAVDTADQDGNTLLMLAAYHGRPETLAMLIARGADVDAQNIRGQGPLAGAIFKGEDEIARALIAAGADLDAGSPSAREAAQIFGRAHLLP